MTARGRHVDRRGRPWLARGSWWPWLAFWTTLGLGIRLGAVLGRPDRVAGGDSFYYHNAANLLVAGKGFINPFLYYGHGAHRAVQTASFPAGFVFALAMASVVGFKSFFAHRIWCCVMGAAAIVVCGLTGREIGGRRVGLIAAFLVAVYPNIWMSDELGLSETLSPLLVALVLLTAYRFWKRPGWWTVVWLGVSIGVAALVRDELSLLGLFILVPLALLAKTLSWGRRTALLAVGGLSSLLVVAPWIGYNMTRFKHPVFISSGLGVTLASANCDTVYSGPFEGYWSMNCALAAPINRNTDESVQAAEAQKYALHFVRTHESRIFPVELARLGRAFGFFSPRQQIRLDSAVETRPYRWALAGLGMYYAMLVLSIGGVVILRRRRVPVLPLLAVGLDVVVTVAIAFGNTRYRTPFEVSLVLLSAVQLDWIWSHLRARASEIGDGAEPPEPMAPGKANDNGAEIGVSGRPPSALGGSDGTDGGEPSEVALPAPAG
jgi:4-amino-4-deoxy-L-arabinose transferase-like glycosyltransferase